MIMPIVPVVSALLYRAGGSDQWPIPINQKLWRWLGIGLFVASAGLISGYGGVSLWSILTYYIATNIPYGEKSFLNIFGEWGKWAICGLVFGLASIPILGYWGILQGIVSSAAFVGLHYLDDKDILKNPWQELLRGFLGTCLFLFI